MKIEKISHNKVKITVTMNDLHERNIDLENLNYNSPEAQQLFWDMMDMAESEYGFYPSDFAQVCIEEVLPASSSADSFDIIITILDDDEEFESIQKFIKNKYKSRDLKTKKKTRKLRSPVEIYLFNDFEDLCKACLRINGLYSGDSTLYQLNNEYYLVLSRISLKNMEQRMFRSIMNEYSNLVSNSAVYEGILEEYGNRIMDGNAVATVCKYFGKSE